MKHHNNITYLILYENGAHNRDTQNRVDPSGAKWH